LVAQAQNIATCFDPEEQPIAPDLVDHDAEMASNYGDDDGQDVGLEPAPVQPPPPRQETAYSIEFLHSLQIPGLPLSKLILKEGVPIVLLWNLNPFAGLCNGTCLLIKKL
jgi:PIF1-like helicase